MTDIIIEKDLSRKQHIRRSAKCAQEAEAA